MITNRQSVAICCCLFQVVPGLTGHTLTYVKLGGLHQIILIGGMTADLVWNPHVYVFWPTGWKLQNSTGTRPKGIAIVRACYQHSHSAFTRIP